MANLLTTTISGGLIHKEGTVTLSGTSLTIDLSTGRTFEVDLESASGNIATFNITNAPASTYVSEFILNVKQGSTARSILWGSLTGVNPLWEGNGGSAGSGPTITATNDKIDIYKFSSWDGGTTWYGRILGQNY
tara:strand:- start:200 stop:601 length:402 start_codon:yes stop_codon:yes gene_type:complete